MGRRHVRHIIFDKVWPPTESVPPEGVAEPRAEVRLSFQKVISKAFEMKNTFWDPEFLIKDALKSHPGIKIEVLAITFLKRLLQEAHFNSYLHAKLEKKHIKFGFLTPKPRASSVLDAPKI